MTPDIVVVGGAGELGSWREVEEGGGRVLEARRGEVGARDASWVAPRLIGGTCGYGG